MPGKFLSSLELPSGEKKKWQKKLNSNSGGSTSEKEKEKELIKNTWLEKPSPTGELWGGILRGNNSQSSH